MGIARLAMYCGARVNIAVDLANRDILGQRRMLEGEEDFIGVTVSPEEALDRLEIGTLVVMTDVSNMANVESLELARRAEKLAVIDHHRKTAEFEREPDVEYIDPSSSSACELIAEMLEQALPRDELSAAEAGVMLAGITLDTMQFSKNTGTRTFSAAMYLRERGADPALVRNLFKESFEEYSGEAQFRRNAEIYRGCCAIAVAEAGEGASPVVAAKAANNLIMVDGMRAAFTLMELGDSVKISARSAGELFLNHQDLLLGKAESAVLLGKSKAIKVILDSCLIELRRESIGNFDLLLHLVERALCELTDLKQIILELLIS